MKHRNPLFPYVYRFGTLIFDWLPYRRYRRETMSNATGGPPTVDTGVRCTSFTYAPRQAGVGTTADVHGC
jgi:hypothetical protein